MALDLKIIMMSSTKRNCEFFLMLVVIFLITSCKKKVEQRPLNLPVVNTLSVTNLTANSATSGGVIANDGGSSISEKGICIGIKPNPTISDTKITTVTGSDTFIVNLSELQPNTVYHIRAYAKNITGLSYGNSINFITPSLFPNYTDTAVTMYVGGGFSKKLFALNATDGTIKWTANLGGYVFSSPFYANGMIYVGCMDSKLYAFDTSGNLRWTANTGMIYTQCPVVSNGIVYFPDDNSINAFNANNGSLIWRFSEGGGNMVLKNNVIYNNSTSLYAIDAITGAKKWEYYTSTGNKPLVCDDRVYVVCDNPDLGILKVINISTGKLLWSKANYDAFNELIGMNFKYGNLYCVSTDGLNILDSATGNVKLPTIPIYNPAAYADYVTPLFSDSLLFIACMNEINVFNASTGNFNYSLMSYTTSSGLTMVNDLIYFTQRSKQFFIQGSGEEYYAGFVSAYNYKTMEYKWTRKFIDVDFLLTAPCIVTQSGKVYRSGYISQ